jgi:hypothetical protein
MGPSEKTFNQVKAILGKLDRNIDQLRERRNTKPIAQPEPPRAPARLPEPLPTPTPRPGSQYGRATPIPPSPSFG